MQAWMHLLLCIIINNYKDMNKLILILLILLALGLFLFFEKNENNQLNDIAKEDFSLCEEESFGLDCDIVNFLKENIGWKNREQAKLFCSYKKLGEKDNEIYLHTYCTSYYVANKEMVCDDEESLEKCFLRKDKSSSCMGCEELEIPAKIVTDSGVSIPVKLTKTDNGFDFEVPEDGSQYGPSLKRIFPADIITEISKGHDLADINIALAENSLGVNAHFNVMKVLNESCETKSDCPPVPGEEMMKSSCPREMKCVNKKCNVICYDFIDHSDLPKLKQ